MSCLGRTVVLLIVALIGASCVADDPPTADPTSTDFPASTSADDFEAVICAGTFDMVPAGEVVFVGELTTDETELVEWAIGRFSLAGLNLPAELAVTFDSTREACQGHTGFCDPESDPPEVFICRKEGDSMFRVNNRGMTLLHELAHMWHVGQTQQGRLEDPYEVVGGLDSADPVPWSERPQERLAVVITWGLMDQLRRPVPILYTDASPFPTQVACSELYRMFQELTGTEPLEPIEEACRP